MSNYVTADELKAGDLIVYAAGGDVVQVQSVDGDDVTLTSGEQVDASYVELIGRLPQVRYFQNKNSGVSHAVLNDRALCGAGHTRNSVSVDFVNCDRCAAIV
jgi:hypothetical protein